MNEKSKSIYLWIKSSCTCMTILSIVNSKKSDSIHHGIVKRAKCTPQCIYFFFQSQNASDLWYVAIHDKLCVMRWETHSHDDHVTYICQSWDLPFPSGVRLDHYHLCCRPSHVWHHTPALGLCTSSMSKQDIISNWLFSHTSSELKEIVSDSSNTFSC